MPELPCLQELAGQADLDLHFATVTKRECRAVDDRDPYNDCPTESEEEEEEAKGAGGSSNVREGRSTDMHLGALKCLLACGDGVWLCAAQIQTSLAMHLNCMHSVPFDRSC